MLTLTIATESKTGIAQGTRDSIGKRSAGRSKPQRRGRLLDAWLSRLLWRRPGKQAARNQ